MSLHEDVFGEVNKVFANEPLDRGGGSNPLRPLGPLLTYVVYD